MRYKNGDISARDELIKHNLRMIVGLLPHYRSWGLDDEDIASEGVRGLIMAIDKFDVENGNRLYTYVIWYVRQEIEKFIRKESKHFSDISLDAEPETGIPSLIERLSVSDNPDDMWVQRMELRADLETKLQRLKKREREFLIEHFGLDKPPGTIPPTQAQISKQNGISPQRTSIIIQDALEKLRRMYEREEKRGW